MRKYHPIWYVRYLIEEFPQICMETLMFLNIVLDLLLEIIFYSIQLLNITIYSKVMLLFVKKDENKN